MEEHALEDGSNNNDSLMHLMTDAIAAVNDHRQKKSWTVAGGNSFSCKNGSNGG